MSEFSGLEQLVKAGQPTGESIDLISGNGKLDELPIFLVNSLRQIVYRLRNAGMWSDKNDIKLYIPQGDEIDLVTVFVSVWSKYFLGVTGKIETERMLSSEMIAIDGVTIRFEKMKSENSRYYYLVTHSVGLNQLIFRDEILNRWIFRAPWAIARFEILDDRPPI